MRGGPLEVKLGAVQLSDYPGPLEVKVERRWKQANELFPHLRVAGGSVVQRM